MPTGHGADAVYPRAGFLALAFHLGAKYQHYVKMHSFPCPTRNVDGTVLPNVVICRIIILRQFLFGNYRLSWFIPARKIGT